MTIAAAVSLEGMKTELREFAEPDIRPDSGLLKVELTGVCGSDWPYYQSYPKARGAMILGHETVGTITRLGRDATARFGFKEGDRVALEEYLPCGHCEYCRSGDFRLCDATDTVNRTDTVRYGCTPVHVEPALWGGYAHAQYLDARSVMHGLPDKISAKLATLALPLGNGVEWVYLQGGLRLGETVVIQGPGQQGLACVVAAKEAGAGSIIVTGLSTEADIARLELARALGADHTIQVDQVDLLETVADITGGQMADLVVDCASGGPETVVSAFRLARKKGRVILGGYKHKPIPAFESDQLISRFLTVKGMRGHGFDAVEMAIGLIASGRYPLERMCTHVFPLSEVDIALRTVGGQGLPGSIHCTVDPWTV